MKIKMTKCTVNKPVRCYLNENKGLIGNPVVKIRRPCDPFISTIKNVLN